MNAMAAFTLHGATQKFHGVTVILLLLGLIRPSIPAIMWKIRHPGSRE